MNKAPAWKEEKYKTLDSEAKTNPFTVDPDIGIDPVQKETPFQDSEN